MKRKKVFCLILVAMSVLILCGCGKSDEAVKADQLILEIGKVSLDSKNAIEKAEFYYSMLNEKQKSQVEHYDYLIQAIEEYTLLEESQKSDEATKADELILEIGNVSLDSKNAIEKAEFYYAMLNEKQKSQVEHYDYLIQAIEEYTLLEESQKSDEATKADELILEIGNVSLDSKNAIEKAEFYYAMLNEKQKAQLEHYDYLVRAREEYDALEEEAKKVVVPDVFKLTKEKATEKLTELDLDVVYKESYSDNVSKGSVVSFSPSKGKTIDKGSKITLTISKGPRITNSQGSYMNWTYIGSGKDDWEFSAPYIKDGKLYINCYSVTFGSSMEWRDRYNQGYAGGTASINDNFDKVVPALVHFEEQKVSAHTAQSFLVEVPLSDLNIEKPTDMYFRIGIKVNGVEKNLEFNIAMTW